MSRPRPASAAGGPPEESRATSPGTARGRTPAAQAVRAMGVLRAARELATEGGYDAIQMREVAKRADVVLKTLYRYYPSKDDLIRAITEDELDTLHAVVLASPPKYSTPHERAAAVAMRVFRTFTADRGFAHAAMSCYHAPRPLDSKPKPRPVPSPTHAFVDTVAMAAWPERRSVSEEDEVALGVLEAVLTTSVIGWLDGEMSAALAERRIRVAAQRLVTDRPRGRRS